MTSSMLGCLLERPGAVQFVRDMVEARRRAVHEFEAVVLVAAAEYRPVRVAVRERQTELDTPTTSRRLEIVHPETDVVDPS
ncbi:MAG: hypothetical protein RMH81_09410 [Thermomicrobium sp.]|nr:hypothetical protein [Thermomicrobium sp.]